MNHNTPLSPRPLSHLSEVHRRVLTTAQLRAHGIPAAEVNEQCRPDGPWQQLLPGVVLLHPGPPTGEERLHAVLMYAARERATGVPVQPGAEEPHRPTYTETMVTGLAALTLHGFTSAPPLPSLNHIDVLVPRMRRLRSTGCARIVRTPALPDPAAGEGRPGRPGAARPRGRGGRARRTRTRYAGCSPRRYAAATANRPRWYGS
jgi:hypothetical protein